MLLVPAVSQLENGERLKLIQISDVTPKLKLVFKIVRITANCKCKLASAGEDSWRKGFSEFQLKKAKQYEPCEYA